METVPATHSGPPAMWDALQFEYGATPTYGCNGQSDATFNRGACEWEPHLLAVLLEFCCLRMFQGTRKRPNLVVVGPSLQRWKV